jgi:acetyl esterase/lipase
MSVRAELLRLGLRAFKGGDPDPDVVELRRQLEWVERFTPGPPKDFTQAAATLGGMVAVRVSHPAAMTDHHVLHLHGGAYVYGTPQLYRDFLWRLAAATQAAVLCPDYRLAPDHPFPAAVDDAVTAYRSLLEGGADPRRIAVSGDSAGGGLLFGTLMKLRDDNIPMPAAAVGISPWTDLSLSGESFRLNAKAEPMLSTDQARSFARHYLGGADPRHPHASPIYCDGRGLPPSLIQVGSDEILRDDAERMAQTLRDGGGQVELEVWHRMPHVWHLFARIVPEGKRAIARIGEFVRGAFAAR